MPGGHLGEGENWALSYHGQHEGCFPGKEAAWGAPSSGACLGLSKCRRREDCIMKSLRSCNFALFMVRWEFQRT